MMSDTVAHKSMKGIYLKIKIAKGADKSEQEPNSWFTRTLENSMIKILTTIIPKANPDFDKKIQDVREWIIEIGEEGIPSREIGIDGNGKVIMIMPWKNNYGYWTDNNLELKDFLESFDNVTIDKEEFERLWNNFDLKN